MTLKFIKDIINVFLKKNLISICYLTIQSIVIKENGENFRH